MSKYKLIQLTNKQITGTAANTYIPLGLVTRKINSTACDIPTFTVGSSLADTVTINEPGYYKITYNSTLSPAAAGAVGVTLISNQDPIYSVSETAAAADDLVNLTLVYVIRVCPNCCSAPLNCPVNIQIQLGDTALSATTASVGNLVIERIY